MRKSVANPPTHHGLSWWIVLVSGLLVIMFTVAIARELIRSQQVRRQVSRLEDQVAVEAERQDKLTELIAYLSSQTYQEREARLKLGLSKPGERVVVVPSGTIPAENYLNQPVIYDQDRQPVDQTDPNFEKWWKYFFNRNS